MNEPQKTILIVEDDAKIAKAMTVRLEAEGYAVQTAGDGVLGSRLAESEPPDLIIADIFMPLGAGFAMAYRLREAAFSVPIIFVTASKDPKVREHAKQFGSVSFLEKPYQPEDLLATVAAALDPNEVAARMTATMAAAEASTGSGQPKKVLIVEDDQKIALTLSIRLQTAGYQVEVANDAVVGAHFAQTFQPDLLLLDITMPGGGGFKVATQVRKLLPKRTAIIFLTANPNPKLKERAAELGAANFFEKPYDIRVLFAAIHDALDVDLPTEDVGS